MQRVFLYFVDRDPRLFQSRAKDPHARAFFDYGLIRDAGGAGASTFHSSGALSSSTVATGFEEIGHLPIRFALAFLGFADGTYLSFGSDDQPPVLPKGDATRQALEDNGSATLRKMPMNRGDRLLVAHTEDSIAKSMLLSSFENESIRFYHHKATSAQKGLMI